MADENEWNFWDYLCGGVNAVFGAIGSIARPFGDGNDFARLREKNTNTSPETGERDMSDLTSR